jgi:hypothetical protein
LDLVVAIKNRYDQVREFNLSCQSINQSLTLPQTKGNRIKSGEIVGMLKKEEENLSSWKSQIERGTAAQDAQGLERLKEEIDKYTLYENLFILCKMYG